MAEVVDIAEESKKYEDEWVVFVVTKVDHVRRPVKGRLVCHGKNRDETHEVALRHRGEGLGLQFVFTGDPIPPDMVAVL